jgi:hypothetical protein
MRELGWSALSPTRFGPANGFVPTVSTILADESLEGFRYRKSVAERFEYWKSVAERFERFEYWELVAERFERFEYWELVAERFERFEYWELVAERFERFGYWELVAERFERFGAPDLADLGRLWRRAEEGKGTACSLAQPSTPRIPHRADARRKAWPPATRPSRAGQKDGPAAPKTPRRWPGGTVGLSGGSQRRGRPSNAIASILPCS